MQVYNVHYSMSINGKVEEGTMEIDAANNMERFSTGSGADEAVEVHDFEIVSWNLEIILPKNQIKSRKTRPINTLITALRAIWIIREEVDQIC